MRRLTDFISRKISVALLGIALVSCSAAGIGMHAVSANNLNSNNCSSTCSSHGQHVAVNSQLNNKDEDDKEPAPPAIFWPQLPVNLALLYVIPLIMVTWFLAHKKKLLLTTQLRF